MNNVDRPRVFVVEDHPLMVFGLVNYLGDRFDVVGSASEAHSAIEMILERRPDLVLLDVNFPGGGGAAVVGPVRKAAPEVKFLAFTVSTSAADVVRMFRAGVDGYVVKNTEGFELLDQIDQTLAGGKPVSRHVAGHILKIDEVAATNTGLETLTPKQREVVTLIARGFKYREVAEELGMGVKTLETHMHQIFEKLGVASRHEMTHLAFDTGFVQPGDSA
jgi:DNA-binding NarL/FixJ family response regulator